jgi:hypothetical protein
MNRRHVGFGVIGGGGKQSKSIEFLYIRVFFYVSGDV